MANIWSRVTGRLRRAHRQAKLAPQLEAIGNRLDALEGQGRQIDHAIGLLGDLGRQLATLANGVGPVQDRRSGPGAVYLGRERVLCRLRLPERLSPDVIYIVDSADLTFVPRLIMDGIYQADGTNFVASVVNETSHCIDVGANFGYFTCALGRMAWRGRVLGIEPDPDMAVLLQVNIEINWINHVAHALNNAAADKPGTLRLRRQRGYSANTTIAGAEEAFENPNLELLEVEAIRVDTLLPQLEGRVDFLKVDVEGAEPLVFRGAQETIARNPQIAILMEWSPDQIQAAGFEPASFTDELDSLGLAPACLQTGGGTRSITWADVRAMSYGDIVMRLRDA